MNTTQKNLLKRFLFDNPFQPATSLWRTFEIAFMAEKGLPGGIGLDLGCGDGRLTRVLLEMTGSRELVGIDPDPLETEQAIHEGLYQRVHTVGGNEIPEPDSSFNFVLSNSVLEHIPDLEPVLTEAARLMKPGSLLIASVPGPNFHACLKGPWIFQGKREAYLKALDKRVAHVRYPTVADWRVILGHCGLELVEAPGYLSQRVVRRWEFVSRLTAGMLVALTLGRKRPIEIQRSMGVRGKRTRLPSFLTSIIAGVISLGLNDTIRPGELTGCLLVIARKP